MNVNDWELAVGVVLLLVSAAAMFAPLVSEISYPNVVLAGMTLVAAVGVVLIGLSRRGRAA